ASFPRRRAVEEGLWSGQGASGGGAASPARRAGEGGRHHTEAKRQSSNELEAFLERVTKARPLIAGYLASAKGQKNDNKISFTFNDTYSADAVTNARELLESIAKEVFGAPVTISVETTAPAPAKEKPIKEDPVLKAFQKHL